jgi:type I restriction enzyme S subunit
MDRSTGNTYNVSKEQNTPGIERRRFCPYPEYKNSGVEWLGKIPAHWEVRRLKIIASVQLSNVDKKSVEGQESVKLCNYVDVYYNDFISSDMDFMPATATPEQVRRFSLQAGDVLITKDSESWTDIAVSALVISDLPNVLCGYHLALVRPTQEDTGGFLAKAFSAIGPRDQFQIAANGITRFGLGGDAIRTSMFAMPPIQEQRAITYFLDRGTARIDELIEKKGRLIELLQEKRMALITQAVTKGLNPTVLMKDSGVEWLGKIPAHWEVKRLRHVGAAIIGLTYEPEEVVGPNEGILVLRASNVYDGHIVLDDKIFVKRLVPDRLITKKGDILICSRSGSRALIGKSAKIDNSLVGLTFGAFMTVFRSVCNDYLFYAFNSTLFNYQSGAFLTSTINQLTLGNLNSFTIPVPPSIEQFAITAFLDREIAKIDALVSRIREVITHLREYRGALVSAAVTGKIDVRTESVET